MQRQLHVQVRWLSGLAEQLDGKQRSGRVDVDLGSSGIRLALRKSIVDKSDSEALRAVKSHMETLMGGPLAKLDALGVVVSSLPSRAGSTNGAGTKKSSKMSPTSGSLLGNSVAKQEPS